MGMDVQSELSSLIYSIRHGVGDGVGVIGYAITWLVHGDQFWLVAFVNNRLVDRRTLGRTRSWKTF